MANTKILSPTHIVEIAVRMVEAGDSQDLSLRAIAGELGVKAPSLYRYFAQKEALELAVAEHVSGMIVAELQRTANVSDPTDRFLATADAYLRFVRSHFSLYSFLMGRLLLPTALL